MHPGSLSRRSYCAWRSSLLLLILLLSLAGSARAGAAPLPRQGPTDPQELEQFLDALISSQMDEFNVPGVTIAVVKDGSLLLAKGLATGTGSRR